MRSINTKYAFLILILTGLALFTERASSWEECDSIRTCQGRALTLSVNSGKGSHYVDISKTQSQKYFDRELTVEMWIKPEQQADKTQFVAGLWGPAQDKNDVWLIYFTPEDSLVFEINGNSTNMKRVDNTIVSIDGIPLYNKWSHLSCVFDGNTETAYLYLDGRLMGSARNPAYPVDRLRKLSNYELPIQIGSCNGLTDNNSYRTFKGQIDEVRLWARALPPDEILCQKDRALYGTEDSLMVYFRLNEEPNVYNLCDASGHGNYGRARSGASCRNSDRPFKTTVIGTPLSVTDTLKCVTSANYTFTITDTSICRNRVWMRMIDERVSDYTITPQNMYLEPGLPTDFDVTLNTEFVGTINSRLQVIPYNWCRRVITIPFSITRITELSYSHSSLDMGVLIAHCEEMPHTDSIIRICNNSQNIGTAHTITISDVLTSMPDVFIPIYPSLPIVLQPGDCVDITVRFKSGDTTAIYNDTLRIVSNDKCLGSGLIPLTGEVQEAIGLTNRSGSGRLDSIDFETVCIDLASDAYNYLWMNLLDENIYIDTIIVPEHFISKSFKFPVVLEPVRGYRPNYFRFLPTAPGIFNDSIIFVVRSNGCTIRRPVYVSGRGFFADVRFETTDLDFGNVIVGQDLTQNVSVKNYSEDTLNVSFYLRKGESFFLTGNKRITIQPGQTSNIPLTFRPIGEEFYEDEICLFEQKCYTASCIPVKGRGYIERFDFDPLVMRTDNVIGCSSKLDTLEIINKSGSQQQLSKFVLDDPSGKYVLVDPPALPGQENLASGASLRFIFEYIPNDVIQERADRAFLRFETSDGQEWAAKMFGTTVIPKFYVTEITTYGTIEVGDRKRDTIIIENISPVSVVIDSLSIPEGYELIYPSTGYLGYRLEPRDSINAIIDFVPDRENDFDYFMNVWSSDPCITSESGFLSGTGITVPLEVPLSLVSFGFVQPCDCSIRSIPLVNASLVFDMTIDSVYIDGLNIANPTPDLFSWTSFFSPGGLTPYNIPPWSRDTLYIKYCPDLPSERRFIDNAARLNIKASGSGWDGSYDTYLAGKRSLNMEPNPVFILFPPTRVDTFSVPQHTFVTMPELQVNPDRLPVIIDSITFEPDERVFYVSDSLGRDFPISVDSISYLPVRLDFKPRAVRNYLARMTLHTSKPCSLKDTTVLVYGSGFAPAFGLDFTFDNNNPFLDTFRLINCDTLKIPIYSSRNFPAEVVDITCRIGYDTNRLVYVGAESVYLAEQCGPHVPGITHSYSQFGGSEFLLKNFCRIDSLRPFLVAGFIAKYPDRDTLKISVDSISFDTEEVILFHIIAETDSGTVVIHKPEFEILNDIVFDSTRVLDCIQRDIRILNTGDVPLAIADILDLPADIGIINSIPPLDSYFDPGDTAVLTLEFCPRRKQAFDTTVYGISSDPCELLDDAIISAIGYAPLFPVAADVSMNFLTIDTIKGRIGDTISVPVYIENDFSSTINNIQYWIEGLRFDVEMAYNPRALKYLRSSASLEAGFDTDYKHGSLIMSFTDVDSLQAGKIAESIFLVTVPDSVESAVFIRPYNFDTYSILFLDIVPDSSEALFVAGERCNINYVEFPDGQPGLYQNRPNPWSEKTEIVFTLAEKMKVRLDVFSITGEKVLSIFNDGKLLSSGRYEVEIDSRDMNSGVYYYVLDTGNSKIARSMILIP